MTRNLLQILPWMALAISPAAAAKGGTNKSSGMDKSSCTQMEAAVCSLPVDAQHFSVVTFEDASIGAHSMYKGVAIGGTLYDATKGESGTVDKTMSYMKTLDPNSSFNFNGGKEEGNCCMASSMEERFKYLADNANSGVYGDHTVVVIEECGDFDSRKVLGLGPNDNVQGEDNGKTLAIFKCTGHITLKNTQDGRPFGPTVIAPFASVTVDANCGFVDGSIYAKELRAEGGKLQLHGDTYDGPIECKEQGKAAPTCQGYHDCGCFTCGDVTEKGDGTIDIQIDHCKESSISWICCTGVDGIEGNCNVVTDQCDAAPKCNGMDSGEFTINIPADSTEFQINTHDGKTAGTADNVFGVCGGSGNQGGSCVDESYTAHCLIDFDVFADCGYVYEEPVPKPEPEPEPKTCPIDMPEIGADCDFEGLMCPYGVETCCDGQEKIKMTMTCNNGVTGGVSRNSCSAIVCPCPVEMPELGTLCSFTGPCDYGTDECCDGSTEVNMQMTCEAGVTGGGPIETCTTVVCEEQGAPEPGPCPVVMPEVGSQCDFEGRNCPYGAVTCCDGSQKIEMTMTCFDGVTGKIDRDACGAITCPTESPTATPTGSPTAGPTAYPTPVPSKAPTGAPTGPVGGGGEGPDSPSVEEPYTCDVDDKGEESAYSFATAPEGHCSLNDNMAGLGWTIAIDATATGTTTYDVYAGSTDCDTTDGVVVGSLSVTYDAEAESCTGAYQAIDDYTIMNFHFYCGSQRYPQTGLGFYTLEESFFSCGGDDAITSPTSGECIVESVTPNIHNKIYAIAHSESCTSFTPKPPVEPKPCPVEMPAFNSPCDFDGECPYFEETCCDGTTHPSIIMTCGDDGIARGFNTDACLGMTCDPKPCPVEMPEFNSPGCDFDGECAYMEETCCDGSTHYSIKMTCDGDGITRGYFTEACMSVQCDVVCTADAFECPDGSFVGRTPPDCKFAECPPVVCTADAFECPDGSFVGRTAPDCEFAECPPDVCTADAFECPDGTFVIRTPPDCEFAECPPVVCTADAFECPDGTFVGRTPPDCEFAECPPVVCTADAFECPDGTFVGRTAPDCEFAECPPVVCTADAFECPDGTFVGRTPPDCEFAECPTDRNVTPSPSPPKTGSGSGDPHFKTWTGEKFDYHGECDLVLLDNPRFHKGLGMRVHIRTTRIKFFSYIEKVALQIGDDVLEFDNDVENFLINGAKVEANRKHHKTMLGPFVVRRDKKAISVRIHEHGKTKIDFHTRKNGFPAVIVDSGSTDMFEGSLGLLGEWGSGRKFARDGIREIPVSKHEATEFALEWQVRDFEPSLFNETRFPQFPTACSPPAQRVANRLGNSHFQKEAEEACAHWKFDKEDCIFDVIATRDVLVAEEGHIEHITS